MSYPGASSGRSRVTPFRTESSNSPPRGSGLPGTRDGMGREGRGKGSRRQPPPGDRPKFRDRFAAEYAWAVEHLPDENPAYVVTAMGMLKLGGQPVTRNSVLARLRATGRSAA